MVSHSARYEIGRPTHPLAAQALTDAVFLQLLFDPNSNFDELIPVDDFFSDYISQLEAAGGDTPQQQAAATVQEQSGVLSTRSCPTDAPGSHMAALTSSRRRRCSTRSACAYYGLHAAENFLRNTRSPASVLRPRQAA